MEYWVFSPAPIVKPDSLAKGVDFFIIIIIIIIINHYLQRKICENKQNENYKKTLLIRPLKQTWNATDSL